MLPPNVKVVALVPEQTVVAPVIVPATETGFTVTVALAVVSDAQTPLVMTAR